MKIYINLQVNSCPFVGKECKESNPIVGLEHDKHKEL